MFHHLAIPLTNEIVAIRTRLGQRHFAIHLPLNNAFPAIPRKWQVTISPHEALYFPEEEHPDHDWIISHAEKKRCPGKWKTIGWSDCGFFRDIRE